MELITSRRPAYVTPNHQLAMVQGGGGSDASELRALRRSFDRLSSEIARAYSRRGPGEVNIDGAALGTYTEEDQRRRTASRLRVGGRR